MVQFHQRLVYKIEEFDLIVVKSPRRGVTADWIKGEAIHGRNMDLHKIAVNINFHMDT